jgi:Na+/H+ antiporter NhaD/arsenite permease-like protein
VLFLGASAIVVTLQLLIQLAQYSVLALSYLGLGLGYLPKLRMNRATIAFTGAALLVGLGLLTVEQAWAAIDAKTIIFLLSMMVVNGNLAYSGFFQLAIAFLLRLTTSPMGLVWVLTWSSGILSAFFLNDTLAIVFTPLVLSLTQSLRLNPIPYLLAVAGATNIGSVATISGNPQNILIGSFSGISYGAFTQALAPLAAVGLIMQIGWLWLLYPEVRSWRSGAHDFPSAPRIYQPLLLKSVGVSLGMLTAFMVGIPIANAAFVAAALLLITRRIKAERILKTVDWNLLVMFSGLFVLARSTQELRLLNGMATWVQSGWGLAIVTTVLSNLISNVPAVLLLQPLIRPDDTQAWLLLAASSTLAGNLTLLGSVANLIVVEAVASLGYRLGFMEHLRFGLPVTLGTLAIAYFWLGS